MPYNLTMDVPSNRDVVDRLRQMDEWIDMHPQYVATNIQPDHFPDRMLVGGGMDRAYLQSGTNNRNTPYNFFATMATPSAGSLHLGKIAKSVGHTLKPAAKFTYKEIVKPVAKEFKKEGTKQVVSLAKEMLKEAIVSALKSETGAGRKPRKSKGSGHSGGNVYPAASSVHSSLRSAAESGNIAAVIRPAVQMALPSDSQPIVPFVSKTRRGRPKGVRGAGSGGKFNLKKALSTASDKVGRYVKEDAVRDLKSVGVHVGREALPFAIGALGQEFGIPAPVGQAVGKMITKKVLSEKLTGVKGGSGHSGKKPKMIGCGDGRAVRAAIVKKVMQERGVKMIVASQIVKAEGLYKP